MMHRPTGVEGPDPGPETRLRTMRILWAVFLINVGLFALLVRFAGPDRGDAAPGAGEVPPLLLALGAAGLSAVVASFPLKNAQFRRAAERRAPALTQTGIILALALCEACALTGVVGAFVTASPYAYLLFALAALGQALHFPRREQVLSAYYKTL